MLEKKKMAVGVVLAAVVLMLLVGFLTCFVRKSREEAHEGTQSPVSAGEQSQDISAGKGETLVYGNLTFMAGNEIVCASADNGEETEYEIPVGTEVITRLGAVTTFSRLSKGNEVALLLDADSGVIKKVWIVG